MKQKTETTNADFTATKDELKNLLKKIKGEESDSREISDARREFKEVLAGATPMMIALAEQELVQEGFTQDDLVTACDIHLELFKDSIEKPDLEVPADHPIARFQEDHRVILHLMEELRETVLKAKSRGSLEAARDELARIERLTDDLLEAENHNVRQENTLFPILERHGLEQPPAIMWMEHTEMKQEKKKIKSLLNERETKDFTTLIKLLEAMSIMLIEKFASHTQKEQNILYVTALEVITDEEWNDIKKECDNLGYFNKRRNQ